MRCYSAMAVKWWDHLGPAGYLGILSFVGIFGYLMMLKSPKRI